MNKYSIVLMIGLSTALSYGMVRKNSIDQKKEFKNYYAYLSALSGIAYAWGVAVNCGNNTKAAALEAEYDKMQQAGYKKQALWKSVWRSFTSK